jgi:hypothetical protein
MQWFKLYGVELMADPKYLRFSASERSCWITLLCLASMDNGVVRNVEEAYLMAHSGISPNTSEWTNTQGILLKFEVLGMITIERDSFGLNYYRIKNWDKRQSKAMTGYERVKKYRQNKRLLTNDNEMWYKLLLTILPKFNTNIKYLKKQSEVVNIEKEKVD